MTPALSTGCVIALLGAEGSGKTALAFALAQRLAQRGIAALCVPDPLPEWRAREGRMPRADEQACIATAQIRRIAEAAQRGIAIADTTALMSAVHSHQRFDGGSLHAQAVAAQRGYTLTLLLAKQEPSTIESLLRAALMKANLPFSVIHGEGTQRLPQAWDAIGVITDPDRIAQATQHGRTAWGWRCDRCSDPGCEHRLFSDLVAGRT